MSESDASAIERFKRYLRIKSVQPNPDYAGCLEFLSEQAKELGLFLNVHYCVPGKPVIILSLLDPNTCSLPGILFNSHMDVVPVDEASWSFPPFGAEEKDGKIYARGSQDMKCVGMMYLEAFRRIRGGQAAASINQFNLHFSFVPDEEIGGQDGMNRFVQTEAFQKLNLAFAFDEGLANPDPRIIVFQGERVPYWIELKAQGVVGHGSQLMEGTAMPKLLKVLEQVSQFREEQVRKLQSGTKTLGDLTSVNITGLKAGHITESSKQVNVVPSEALAYLDIRLGPDLSSKELLNLLSKWTNSGTLASYSIINKPDPKSGLIFPEEPLISQLEKCSLWKDRFELAIKEWSVGQGLKEHQFEMFRGATDARFLRFKGIPAASVSPLPNTPILLHDHDEFLGRETFLRGIEFYRLILQSIK